MASRTNRGRLPPRPAPVSARNNRSTSVVSDTGVNPLIDDLLGSVISSHNNSTFDPSSLIGQSISNRNSLVESDWGASPRSSSRMNKSSKMAIDTLSRISQHFVHTMRMFNMEDYFTAPNRDEAVRKMLREKTSVETEGLVISLLDLLEDVRNSRGQVAPLTGSLSALDGGRERLLSASMFSTMSTASMMRQPVQETTRVAMAIDKKGNRMINRYTIVANLGQGAFGKVKLGEEADSGNQVAIKIIDKKLLKKKIGGPDNDEALKREIAIMKKVRHKNCVSLYEVIDDPDSNKLYLIMDYVPNGPIVKLKQKQLLGNFLTSVENGKPIDELLYNKYLIRSIVRRSPTNADKPFSKAEIDSKPYIFWCTPVEEQLCAIYLRQLVSGLRYMHKRALVHHDIKPDNILLGNDHHVYLTDFGVSEMLGKRPGKAEEGEDKTAVKNEAPKLGGGTLVFTAPELFEDSQGENFNPYLTDVWALGVTVYCMLLGCLPFFGTSYPEISACVRNNPFPWNGQTLHSKTVLPQWKTILDGMLEKDPQKRWHLSQLKTFLDNKKFQEELRQTNPDFDGDRSMSSLLSDLAETQKAEAGMDDLRLIEEEMSKGDPLPLTLPKHRTISARARSAQIRHSISIRAREEELNKIEDEHLNDLKISASDIKQATTNMKVEIVEEAALVTPHTSKDCVQVRGTLAKGSGGASGWVLPQRPVLRPQQHQRECGDEHRLPGPRAVGREEPYPQRRQSLRRDQYQWSLPKSHELRHPATRCDAVDCELE
ncbi:Protein kinase domain/Protein tyrosine kinase/Kinase-like, putative [Angomonas deanei]|uniref:non-specific serine/threonine protein kinase n=1 Tax=Angomonas deanei TaxID=59799 RepID=A0A7G2CAM7_9TRYP|nr:Protein kinase domain/Protein tyrosine kinase/Kinase-like, putative [Angomonas deanei]